VLLEENLHTHWRTVGVSYIGVTFGFGWSNEGVSYEEGNVIRQQFVMEY
jgi:hypothetical protein